MELTQAYLKSILHYDPETGNFTWAINVSKKMRVGSIAGSVAGNGYRVIRINEKCVRSHRLAFLYMLGSFPDADTDHINGIKTDNRWCNLRAVSNAENCRNQRLRITNTSGFLGVSFHNGSGKYRAAIRVNGKSKHIGLYDTPEEAAFYRERESAICGYHPNHGRSI